MNQRQNFRQRKRLLVPAVSETTASRPSSWTTAWKTSRLRLPAIASSFLILGLIGARFLLSDPDENPPPPPSLLSAFEPGSLTFEPPATGTQATSEVSLKNPDGELANSAARPYIIDSLHDFRVGVAKTEDDRTVLRSECDDPKSMQFAGHDQAQ